MVHHCSTEIEYWKIAVTASPPGRTVGQEDAVRHDAPGAAIDFH